MWEHGILKHCEWDCKFVYRSWKAGVPIMPLDTALSHPGLHHRDVNICAERTLFGAHLQCLKKKRNRSCLNARLFH